MIDTNVEYEIHNESGCFDKIYLLQLGEPVNLNLSTDQVIGLSTYQIITKEPILQPATLMLFDGTSSVGNMKFSLTDANQVLSTARQVNEFLGVPAVVKLGFRGMHVDDYLTVMNAAQVSDFDFAGDGDLFDLEVSDAMSKINSPIFASKDIASEPFTTTEKEFDGGSLTLIDSDSDGVYDRVRLQGNAIDLALKLLISGGDSPSTDYNVWPVWAGAGMYYDPATPELNEVDADYMLTMRDQVMAIPIDMTFSGDESVKSIIDNDFALALGGYFILSGQGRPRIVYPVSPNPSATLERLDDSNILDAKRPSIKDSREYHVTHIKFFLDYDGSSFLLELPMRASPQFLSGKYKNQKRIIEIKSRGLQSINGGVGTAYAVMDKIFQLYGDPAFLLSIDCFFKKHLVEPGDIVEIKTIHYKDLDGIGPDAIRYGTVLNSKPGQNKMSFELIDLTKPLKAGRRGVISPAGTVDYTSATTEEKNTFAWLADEATEQMSNGDEPYSWS